MSAILELSGITKTFTGPDGDVRAIEDFSLSLEEGDFVALRGPSGSGKTTVLLTAGGMMRPTSGSVDICGTDIYELGSAHRAAFRADRTGFVFQEFHLLPYLSVRQNVLVPTLAREIADIDERVDALLDEFGMTDRANHLPDELSTGERQRVALARALLGNPAILFADEPTGNLDDANAKAVEVALQAFAEGGGAVLLVTHDDRVAAAAGQTVHLDGGRAAPATGSDSGDTP